MVPISQIVHIYNCPHIGFLTKIWKIFQKNVYLQGLGHGRAPQAATGLSEPAAAASEGRGWSALRGTLERPTGGGAKRSQPEPQKEEKALEN